MKARDIIAGWPRGRSVMRPYWTSRDWLLITCDRYFGGERPSARPKDPRWQQDWEGELAEEKRKADMMAIFYMYRMIGAEQASDWPWGMFPDIDWHLCQGQLWVGLRLIRYPRRARLPQIRGTRDV